MPGLNPFSPKISAHTEGVSYLSPIRQAEIEEGEASRGVPSTLTGWNGNGGKSLEISSSFHCRGRLHTAGAFPSPFMLLWMPPATPLKP